jgi:hypothetical protein
MSLVTLALFILAMPAALAGATAMVFGWAGRRFGMAGAGPAALAIALGAGTLAAQLVNAPPAWPPVDVTDRIPLIVLVATLLGLCESLRPSPAWARWENRVLLSVLMLGLILGPVLGQEVATGRHVAGLLLVVLLEWTSLENLASRRSTAVLGPALLVAAGCTGAALLMSGSLVLFQIGTGLAVALGAVWVLSCGLRSWSLGLSPGAIPVLVATFAALLIDGRVYVGMPWASALLLGVAPLVPWLGFVWPMRRLAPWQAAIVSAVAAGVPAAIALVLIARESTGYE